MRSRSLGLPSSTPQHVGIKERERRYDEATLVEGFVILNTAAGEGVDDLACSCNDPDCGSVLDEMPSPEAVREFLSGCWYF
jgi:hypothetical protein